MKLIPFFLAFLLSVATLFVALAMPMHVSANEASEAGQSAIPTSRVAKNDSRIEKLSTYLASHNSPLAAYAPVFVQKADKYKLDWRLVAAISGVESTFGKNLPESSYNAYGWNGGNFAFKNWEDGIDTVSKTLREKYIDTWGADTVSEIAYIYCPPSSNSWAGKVNYFMEQITLGPKTKDPTLALKLTI